MISSFSLGCRGSEEQSQSGAAPILDAPARTSVPLLPDSTDTVVHVSIGPLDSLRFLLDSGAPVMLLSSSLHRRLESVPSVSRLDEDNIGPILELDSFRVGAVTLGETKAWVTTPPYAIQRRWHEGQSYDGILGWRVLDSLDFAYDLARHRLHFFRASPRPPRQSPVWSVVPDHFACNSFPYVHGSGGTARLVIRRDTVSAVLDTGANPSVLSWRAARAAGITKKRAQRLDERAIGLDTSSAVGSTVHLARLGNALLGTVPLDTARVRISNLSWFETDTFGENTEAMIGNDLLAGGIVIRTDSADRRLQHVCRPSLGTPTGRMTRLDATGP